MVVSMMAFIRICDFVIDIKFSTWPLQPIIQLDWLRSFGSFGKAVSKEKIFRNQPIRNKNCLWQPCLLMDGDEMSNLYRGPSKDASYQVFLIG
jgi:hypothetical protein